MRVSFSSQLKLREWDPVNMGPVITNYTSDKLRNMFKGMLSGEDMDEFVVCMDKWDNTLKNDGKNDSASISRINHKHKDKNRFLYENPYFFKLDLQRKTLIKHIMEGTLFEKLAKL